MTRSYITPATLAMQNNYKTEVPYYLKTETSVSASVPPENTVPFPFPLSPKKIRFYFRSADFRFCFHIFIMFPFIRGKVGKFLLHFHPYIDVSKHSYK
jgi:hypothetical protein